MQLPDGSRRFWAGAARRDDDNEPWHPIPNVRLHAAMLGTTWDKYRKRATELSEGVKLSDTQREKLVDLFSVFIKAYGDLKTYLATPQARGVSMAMMSTELSGLWSHYLFTGRQLLDFAGLRSRAALKLKDDIGGLNRDKFATLKAALGKDPAMATILRTAQSVEATLNDLIDLRNQDKDHRDTIVETPEISPEGRSSGGLVRSGQRRRTSTSALSWIRVPRLWSRLSESYLAALFRLAPMHPTTHHQASPGGGAPRRPASVHRAPSRLKSL